ncbi:MAG: protein-glutamate O-methyltransferase CheR, partial [Rhodospirillales bacterium]
ALISELTIGETYFFRHPEVFEALTNHILPDVLKANAERRAVRIWSAGCSTGAEPYSLSILLNQKFSSDLAGWRAEIIGTDIDKKFLAFAERGLYQDWALRVTQEPERSNYFQRTPLGWQLRPAFRKAVRFHHHNLIRDEAPNPLLGLQELDIILCRNVAIYFNREQIAELMRRFHDCLNPSGWLITGPAEIGMDLPGGFMPVNLDGLIVYRKDDTPFVPHKQAWTAPVLAFPEPPQALMPLDLPPVPALPLAANEAGGDTASELAVDENEELLRLSDRGQWGAALGLARRALDRAEAPLDIKLRAVQVFAEAGDVAGAIRALKHLLFVDRRCQMAYYHLGLLQSSQGDAKMACKAFKNAYDLAVACPADDPVPGGEGLTHGKLAEMAQLRIRHEGGS